MKKQLPKFKTDSALEDFLNEDLTDYLTQENLSGVTFEFEPKEKVVNLRMSTTLFNRIKNAAEKRKIPYQRFIRLALEQSIKN
ncbi:MAG: CopG family antitoxin [Pyrinomonadaceae bacterium]